MRWFLVAVSLLSLVCAAVVYAVAVVAAARVTKHPRAVAGALAAVAAVLTGVSLVALRPTFPPEDAPVPAGHAVACETAFAPAQGVVTGSVDLLATEPGAALADGAAVDRNAALVSRGWAAARSMRGPVSAVCLTVDGTPLAGESATYGTARADVAAYFHNAAVAETGFEIRAPARGIAPGRHLLRVIGVDAAGRSEALAPPRRVIVR